MVKFPEKVKEVVKVEVSEVNEYIKKGYIPYSYEKEKIRTNEIEQDRVIVLMIKQ